MTIWILVLIAFSAIAYTGKRMRDRRGGFGDAWAAILISCAGLLGLCITGICFAVREVLS
jgi:formate hydrogenlyase subunit 3/multisubunit Na+/H+ antiporter MnhD subunit